MDNLTLDDLCVAANSRLGEAAVADGRTNPRVTPRVVRYYQSLSLLSPVGRVGGRAAYTDVHVAEVVAIKRAQADGLSLKEIADRVAAGEPSGRVYAGRPAAAFGDGADRGASEWARALIVRGLPGSADVVIGDGMPWLRSRSTSPQPRQQDAISTGATIPGGVVSGWSIDLPGGVRLSGIGEPPTRQVVDQIAALLRPGEPAALENSAH